MANKMKFWRKNAKKQADGTRTGRALRNYMASAAGKGMISPIHVWLFRAAGIATPVYDSHIKAQQDAKAKFMANAASAIQETPSEDITDVEVLPNAA